jgi:phosphoserine phosphatase
MDELRPVAEEYALEVEYAQLLGNISIAEIEKYMKVLRGAETKNIADIMNRAKPYPGAAEAIGMLRKYNFYVAVITDDTLAAIPEVKSYIKSALGLDELRTTSSPEIIDSKLTGNVLSYEKKERIVEDMISDREPKSLLGIFQGANDLPAAKTVRDYSGYVVAVNSSCRELECISQLHMSGINESEKLSDFLKRYF